MFGPAWHCLTQFDVQADSVLQMVLDLGRYLDNHPIPDHEDIVNIIKEIVGTIVTSVNGKTGEVNLKLSDVTGTDSWPVWILSNAEYGEITDATMLDAYDNDGFRLLYVQAGDDPEKEPAFLMIPGRTFNPDGITRYIFTGGGGSGGGAVQSVNGKVGTVVLTADDVGALPDTYVPPAPPVTSVNTKTGEVVLSASDVGAPNTDEFNALAGQVGAKYGPDNAPPYPVTGHVDDVGGVSFFVNGGGNVGAAVDGAGNVIGLNTVGNSVKMYSSINPPPYPVTSVNGFNGDVKGLCRGGMEGTFAAFRPYGNDNYGLFVSQNGGVISHDSTGAPVTAYSTVNKPPIIDSSSDTAYFIKSNNSNKPNIYFGEVAARFYGEDISYRFTVPNVTTVFWVFGATFVAANIAVGRCYTSGSTVYIKPANSDAPGVGSTQNIVYMVFGA